MSSIRLFRRFAAIGVVALFVSLVGCANLPSAPSAEVRAALAPTGTFRLALYHFNPVQVSKGAQTGNYEGLAIDLGRALANRLEVPFAAVPFTDLAKMSACVAGGECDAMVIATDAAIAKDFALTSAFVELDNSYLVAANSPIRTASDVDRSGTRIAVYTGSAVHLSLKEKLKQAELRTTVRGAERVEWLRSGQVDALADGVHVLQVLFMPQVSGSRIVDGSFSTTTYVLGVTPDRRVGGAFLTRAVEELKRSGQISESISRWSLNARVPSPRP